MDYVSMLDLPPLSAVLISVVQTATLYALVLGGLEIVGRRVFAEQGPQDLIILVLIAEACDLGLSHEDAGYWGTVTSVLTILLLGWLCEKIPFLRKLIDSPAVLLFKDGHLYRERLKKFMIEEEDLEVAARSYGLSSYHQFNAIFVEGDGTISGTPRAEFLRQV